MNKGLEIMRKAGMGYALSTIIFCVMSFIIAVASCYTAVSIKAAYICLVAVLCMTVFIASLFVGSAFGRRGIFVGLGSGFVYLGLFIFLATTALSRPFISEFLNPIYIVPVVCGGAGGIVGTNLRK